MRRKESKSINNSFKCSFQASLVWVPCPPSRTFSPAPRLPSALPVSLPTCPGPCFQDRLIPNLQEEMNCARHCQEWFEQRGLFPEHRLHLQSSFSLKFPSLTFLHEISEMPPCRTQLFSEKLLLLRTMT